MTSAITHASQQDGAELYGIQDVGTFQVLVSCYDAEDFKGGREKKRWGR